MRVGVFLLVLGLAACGHVAASDALQPVERPARIRLFGQNGVSLTMYTNARCEDTYDEEVQASGSLGYGFKALLGKRRPNEVLGIAQTVHTRTLEERNYLRANPYYLEYPLVPGQPVMLEAQISAAVNFRCARNVRGLFVPEAGQDYEGDMIRNLEERYCAIEVRSVDSTGGALPLRLDRVEKDCPAPAPRVPAMALLFGSGSVQYRYAEHDAGIDELDDHEESLEDFASAMQQAPILPGMTVCVIAPAQVDPETGPVLAPQLASLMQGREHPVRIVQVDATALAQHWQLTEERPLTFPLAEYYCQAIAGR